MHQSDHERSWREVQAGLAHDEAAVEIIRVPDPTGALDQYVSVVLRATGIPRLVPLGPAAKLEGEGLVHYLASRNGIDGGPYDLFWRPLAAHLEGVLRIHLSPDGVYARMDLNTLFISEKGKFLLDELDLSIVDSTGDILNTRGAFQGGGHAQNKAVLLGRPAYGFPQTEGRTSAASLLPSFSDLPGTAIEVQEIAALLRDKGFETDVYVADDASCAVLRAVQSPRVLHLATHGFYHELYERHIEAPDGKVFISYEEDVSKKQQIRTRGETKESTRSEKRRNGI